MQHVHRDGNRNLLDPNVSKTPGYNNKTAVRPHANAELGNDKRTVYFNMFGSTWEIKFARNLFIWLEFIQNIASVVAYIVVISL